MPAPVRHAYENMLALFPKFPDLIASTNFHQYSMYYLPHNSYQYCLESMRKELRRSYGISERVFP